MKEYKKSYKGLIIMLAVLAIYTALVLILPGIDIKGRILLLFNGVNLWIVLLMFIIYKTGAVYWFTGMNFETAEKMDPETRNKYSVRSLIIFMAMFVLYGIYTLVSKLLNIPFIADIIVESIAVTAAALISVLTRPRS